METSNKSIVVESFAKTHRIAHPTNSEETKSLVFDPTRQRNTGFLDKGISKPGRISYDVLRRAAQSVHVARICINVLKEKVTKTKWMIKPKDSQKDSTGDKRIEEITDLLARPNENNETFRTLLDKILEDLLILDSVTIEKTRYPNGKIARLYQVDSSTIRPVFDELGNMDIPIALPDEDGHMVPTPTSYIQVLNNSQFGGPESGEIVAAWPKSEMIHFHMHPQGSMEGVGYGLSPLESVLSVVANILNADNYNGTYFEEGSFPPVIIQILGQVSQRDIESYRNYLESELNGNFHRPAIMAGGQEAKVLNLKDLTNRDMEFMEYMKFMSRLLAAAYGLSGDDIGLTEETGSKSVAENNTALSNQKGYSSVLNLIKEQINLNIIWGDFEYKDLEFDWVADDNINPKDMSDIHDKALRNGTMTINEIRQREGKQPYGTWADQPMILLTDGFAPIQFSEPMEDTTDPNEDTEQKDIKPDVKHGDKPEKKEVKKSSIFKRIMKAVFSGDDADFELNPVMFGRLVNNEQLKDMTARLFVIGKKDLLNDLDFKEVSYTYDFNQAKTALRIFIDKNPHGLGGILYEESEVGIKYCVYVKNVNI